MGRIPSDYMHKVYAGWLGKIIGVRHGAPIESWTYEKIERVYGEINDYLVDYRDFAADDDSNGPMFFLRALEDYTYTSAITAEQIGLTWLNYTPYEHGFYWWGGYGKSTEHTAYLNLRGGIMAPYSGSVEQNGAAVAEQIGGQIFIDTWGLVAPGDPSLAAEYAQKAASVSHGANGVYGGMFIAACISAAFIEQTIEKIIEAGLSVIPPDCEYARVTREVMKYYLSNPDDWKDCFKYVKDYFGYDRYPGTCHIIPNSAIIVLSLLYCKGDFSKAINICNMCGWDTDCNVANVGTIMGIYVGLEGIDYKWKKPINDLLICSSVIGSLNIMDIPWDVVYIANLAYKIAGEQPPEEWKLIVSGNAPKFHFQFPGSTHGFRVASDSGRNLEYDLRHTVEEAHSGKGSLKVVAKPIFPAEDLMIYHKTYYRPKDFHDSRYDPSFSPILYPGQTLKGCVMIPKYAENSILACLYVKDGNGEGYIESEKVELSAGTWHELYLKIPPLEGGCIEEAGVKLIPKYGWMPVTLVAYLDDFDFCGIPDYTIDFTKERMEVWNALHLEVSQFTYLKGIWKLEDGELSGSTNDFGEAYTGGYDWKDYSFEATMIPKRGKFHNINFRVQGAIRSYAVGLADVERLVLYKNENGYRTLMEIPFQWEYNREYTFRIEVVGNNIKVMNSGKEVMNYNDENMPYMRGQIGVSLLNGSHCHYKNFIIGKP